MSRFYTFLVCLMLYNLQSLNGQARIIINNGGIINLNGGTSTSPIYLVVDNAHPNAITRITNGYISSENEFNRIKWMIGNNNGNYMMPLGYAGSYIPVSFSTSSAVGATGFLELATYHGATWLNTSYLPSTVTHFFNYSSTDNSNKAIDRFWMLNPINYTTKPALSNLTFSYLDVEHTVASNVIIEDNLFAQRFNPNTNDWDDFYPGGIVDNVANTVTVPSVPSAQLFPWWTLVDRLTPLPISLMYFTGDCDNNIITFQWETASEVNNDYFIIEGSENGQKYHHLDTVISLNGNASFTQQYQTKIKNTGFSYFRLKQVDVDGQFSYSSIIKVDCQSQQEHPLVSIYPNPTSSILNISTTNFSVPPSFSVFDITGKEISNPSSFLFDSQNLTTKIDVSLLSNGSYILLIKDDNDFFQSIKFVKQ